MHIIPYIPVFLPSWSNNDPSISLCQHSCYVKSHRENLSPAINPGGQARDEESKPTAHFVLGGLRIPPRVSGTGLQKVLKLEVNLKREKRYRCKRIFVCFFLKKISSEVSNFRWGYFVYGLCQCPVSLLRDLHPAV